MIWRLCSEKETSPLLTVAGSWQLHTLTSVSGRSSSLEIQASPLTLGTYFIILRRLETINLGRGAERAPELSLIEMLEVFSGCRVAAVTCFALIRSYHESA